MAITGNFKKNSFTFRYGEKKFGKGRGIRLVCNDQKTDFMIKPNPHNADKKYNKKHEEWYSDCAESFASSISEAAHDNRPARLNWPEGPVQVTVWKYEYTLEPR